jgi:hypothetical protein
MIGIRRFAPVLACMTLCGGAHAAVLTMGVGGNYSTLASAVAAALTGDTILVEPGTYTDQVATINVPLTIQGNGTAGQVVFTQSAAELPGLKGYLVTNADTTVQNITFQNAAISLGNGDNGAGIRYQGGNLTVINSQFNNNQEGILGSPGTPGTGTILIQNSSFNGNGVATGPAAGFEHGIYIGMVSSLTVIGSTFTGTLVGHDIKSRAANSTIRGNTLENGVTGTSSYAIDLPDGGVGVISGNTIYKGPNSQNWTTIAYSEEDTSNQTWAANSLLVSGNAILSTNDNAIGVDNWSGSVTADINCNAFDNVPTISIGSATLTNNVTSGGIPACGQTVPEPPGLTVSLAGIALLAVIRPRRKRQRLAA